MDDDVELNFAGPSTEVPKHSVPKGGRWTDRAAAKKVAKRAFQSANRPKSGTFISPSSVVPSLTTPAPATTGVFKEGPASNAPIGLSRTEPRITQKDDQATQPARRIPSTIDAAAGPSRHPGAIAQATSTTTASKGKAPQIISSLFTSNPTYKPTKQGVEAVPGAPSNAPLRGNTDTFAGLGLDPLLVNHMKQKTGLKAPTAIQRSALPALLSAPLNIDSPPAEYDNGGIPTNSPSNGLPSEHDPAQASVRDALIQSQTGSGKTLTYLLPIIQTLLPLSQLSYIDRSIGTLAIILAPTRELAQQIEKVLESLLSMSLSLPDSSNDTHYTRWLVSGLLTGGATKTHEKARLRKGVPILVATPGRLLDHLQNTSSFQCGKTLFLVLDEADRLMDLGFEETITGIIKALDGRRKLAVAAEKELDELGGGSMRWPFWGRGRQTILCSATVDAKVEKLAGMTLRDPIIFRATEMDVSEDVVTKSTGSFNKHDQILERLAAAASSTIELPKTLGPDKFTPPSQLTQKYVVVPSKLRLVTLVALLRSLTSSMDNAETNKVIVFLTSTDTVDFHWRMMGGVQMGETATVESPGSDVVTLQSPLLPKSNIQRLHGSLPLAIRRSSLASFASPSESPSILLATSVASRGLDLPLVKSVIQYELPTEGGTNEYVHRVGRTARAGKGGEAWAFVGPAEAAWVPWVEGRMGTVKDESGRNTTVKLREVPVEDVLRKGFGGKGYEFEARATDVQLSFERWVLSSEQNTTLARKAFASSMRAYSTHPVEEKAFFHPKTLHLGHVAKSFALRETPSSLGAIAGHGVSSRPTGKGDDRKTGSTRGKAQTAAKRRLEDGDSSDDEPRAKRGKEQSARNETEVRMYAAVRKAGRAVKSGGALGEFSKSNGRGRIGNGEYHVMESSEVERLVSGKR